MMCCHFLPPLLRCGHTLVSDPRIHSRVEIPMLTDKIQNTLGTTTLFPPTLSELDLLLDRKRDADASNSITLGTYYVQYSAVQGRGTEGRLHRTYPPAPQRDRVSQGVPPLPALVPHTGNGQPQKISIPQTTTGHKRIEFGDSLAGMHAGVLSTKNI
eukprot:m.970168 g.970168  ORF g.970168 m.970168 type:complete len:157 (-) comp23922_c1_seq25:627-1097(-)